MNYRRTPSLRSSSPSLSPRTSSRNRNHPQQDSAALRKPPDSARSQFRTTPNTGYYNPRPHTQRSDYLNGVSCSRKKSTIQRGASIWRSGDQLLSSTEQLNFVTPSNLLCNYVASVGADSPIGKSSVAKSSVRRKKTLPANRTDSTLVTAPSATRLHNIPRSDGQGRLSGQQPIIKGELTSRLPKYSFKGNHELETANPTRVDFKKYSHSEEFPPDWWKSSACPPTILDHAKERPPTSDDSSEGSMVVGNQHVKRKFGVPDCLKNDLLSNCRAAQNSLLKEPHQSLVNESRFLDIGSKIYKFAPGHECHEPQSCCLHRPAGDKGSSRAGCERRSLSNSKIVRRMTSGVDLKRVGRTKSYAPTIQGRFPDNINGLGIVGRDEDRPRREDIGVVGTWERHLGGLATTRIYRSSPRLKRLPEGGNLTARVHTTALVKPVEVQSVAVKPVQSGMLSIHSLEKRRVVVRSRLYKGSCTNNASLERSRSQVEPGSQVPKSPSFATCRKHRVASSAIKESSEFACGNNNPSSSKDHPLPGYLFFAKGETSRRTKSVQLTGGRLMHSKFSKLTPRLARSALHNIAAQSLLLS